MSQPSSQRVYLLGNPAAGSGRGAAALERAQAALSARGVRATLLRTERPNHAVELSRQAAVDGADLLLVLGGDGTIRDCVEGVLTGSKEGSRPVLGVLPGGTGNDLVRSVPIPKDLDAALEVALSGEDARLDVWCWNGTPFLNVAGVGLDAAVAGVVNRNPRRIKGTLGYVIAALSTLPRFEPTEITVRMPDREWAGRVWLVAFGNACCYGGGMKIAPGADPRDGLLDIVIVEAMPRLQLLGQLPALFSGTHVRHPRVHVLRAEWVEVQGPPQEATLDGELVGTVPGSIHRSPTSIRVRVPAAWARLKGGGGD